MKTALIFLTALSLVCVAGLMGKSMAQEDPGREVVKITDGTNPAYFPHRDHQNRLNACGICHHGRSADNMLVPYAQAETPKSRKCATCHNRNADGVSLDDKIPGMSPIQRAGHGLCQGCHRDQRSSRGTPINLLACTTCHAMYRDKVQ